MRTMRSNKGILLVVVMVVAALIILWQNLLPISNNEAVIAADSTFDVDSNYFPPSPMTAIYFYENELIFANNDLNVMHVPLFIEVSPELCDVVVSETPYFCSLDASSGTLTFTDAFSNMLGPYSFVEGKVSDKAIEFPLGVKYRYLVSKDRKRFYLLLEKQDFSLQFGKTLSFKGIDLDLDGKADISYFAPAMDDFKEITSSAVAIFEVDSDEDMAADVKFFVSPQTAYLIEPGKSYKWPVIFWAPPKWRGFNLGKDTIAKKAPNGTAILMHQLKLVIRMPDTKE